MWIKLTSDALLARVAAAEESRLRSAATRYSQSDPLAEIAQQLANEWRSGLRRVTTLDTRSDHVPDELLIHILADFRYRAYTRLPGMSELLDPLRVKEWERANNVRDNLHKVSIAAPDPAYAETEASSGRPDPVFTVPTTVLERD